jgi:hypothetical protein
MVDFGDSRLAWQTAVRLVVGGGPSARVELRGCPLPEAEIREQRTPGRHETKPRHPFAEPFLMNLGASRIVHKTQPGEVLAAVEFILAESSGISSKRPIAAAAKVG